jgi:hypothetical protein
MARPRGNTLRLPFAAKSLSVFWKKSLLVRRDFSHAVQRRLPDLDGRWSEGSGSSHPRRSTAPDAGQRGAVGLRDTLLATVAPMRK